MQRLNHITVTLLLLANVAAYAIACQPTTGHNLTNGPNGPEVHSTATPLPPALATLTTIGKQSEQTQIASSPEGPDGNSEQPEQLTAPVDTPKQLTVAQEINLVTLHSLSKEQQQEAVQECARQSRETVPAVTSPLYEEWHEEAELRHLTCAVKTATANAPTNTPTNTPKP